MQARTKYLVGAAVLVAVAGAGTGVAVARGGDSDRPVTGPALQRASTAALAHTGGGTVTGSEIGDEEGYYEIEVTLEDGSQVDVHLDRGFHVIGDETDHGDDAGGDDDGDGNG
jgi:hypothetical protein